MNKCHINFLSFVDRIFVTKYLLYIKLPLRPKNSNVIVNTLLLLIIYHSLLLFKLNNETYANYVYT